VPYDPDTLERTKGCSSKTVASRLPDSLYRQFGIHTVKRGISKSLAIRQAIVLWLKEPQ
jgi:hypothetical protein